MARATTSATGTSIAECAHGAPRVRGFTLIELLVVVVIIGLVSAGAILAIGTTGQDRELERETDRLATLLRYAREQAELQSREIGLLVAPGAYEFRAYDVRHDEWRPILDEALHPRDLPDGLGAELAVEGRPIVLNRATIKPDAAPQVMIFSNGDLTSFELRLRRQGGRSERVASDESGAIVSGAERASRP
ncbi:MAG: type II secretion system minor pseudopilin GspH [Steroidobacteraceae bacterium]